MNNSGEQTFKETLKGFEKEISNMEKAVVACCGLTFTQCNTLMEIGKAGCISLNKLADLLEVDNSTMSQTTSKLVKQKLVERETDANDRRYVTIVLTEEGQKAFKNIQNGMNAYYSGLYASIPENKRSQIIESLKIINEILQHKKGCNL